MFSTSLQTSSSKPELTLTGSSCASTVRLSVDGGGLRGALTLRVSSTPARRHSPQLPLASPWSGEPSDTTTPWPSCGRTACTANTGPIARSITVRNALSMSTGHSAEQLLEPTLASRRPPDLNTAQTLLATEPEGRPGVDFAYNNLATWMLSRIVARHTGEDVDTIISKEVLTPIGAGAHTWVRDADGIPLGFSGLHIDAEDLSVFGQLLLDEGVHDGTRLLPEEWIAQHRVRQVDCAHDTSPE